MKTLVATLALLVSSGIASANVSVSGTGKVQYVPDTGHITVGVNGDGATAKDAWAKNRAIVEKIFAFLRSKGIDPKDMQTSGLNVSPKYHHVKDQPPQLIGYTVHYDLKVTVRDLDQVGMLLDGMIESGANTNVSVGFGIANPDQLMDEARANAVREAKKKAKIYADAAGAQLGNVISISDQFHAPYRELQFEYAPMAAGKGMPIAVGTQQMEVTVQLVFGIYPK